MAHSLWTYILQTCTVKKKKDLVKFQQEKYASILNNPISTLKLSNEFERIGITANEMNQYMADALQTISDDKRFTASAELVKINE